MERKQDNLVAVSFEDHPPSLVGNDGDNDRDDERTMMNPNFGLLQYPAAILYA